MEEVLLQVPGIVQVLSRVPVQVLVPVQVPGTVPLLVSEGTVTVQVPVPKHHTHAKT